MGYVFSGGNSDFFQEKSEEVSEIHQESMIFQREDVILKNFDVELQAFHKV